MGFDGLTEKGPAREAADKSAESGLGGADLKKDVKKDNILDGASSAGVVFGNVGNASTIYYQQTDAGENRFTVNPRHSGFAAEQANHLYDTVTGHKTEFVGDIIDENTGVRIKNGADRIVDGVEIQSKYCNSGSSCVNECFEDNGKGGFRYWNSKGQPMQIEVPSDKYGAAVQAMEEKIRRGQVEGVTDPAQAKNIIRKGHFTYEQVKNIAKPERLSLLLLTRRTEQ